MMMLVPSYEHDMFLNYHFSFLFEDVQYDKLHNKHIETIHVIKDDNTIFSKKELQLEITNLVYIY